MFAVNIPSEDDEEGVDGDEGMIDTDWEGQKCSLKLESQAHKTNS